MVTPKRPPRLQNADDIATLKMVAVASAEAVYHYRLVARSIGRDEDTLIEWRKKDPEFSERLEEARFRFINKQVRKSKPEFLLERLEPEIFKQRSESDLYVKELPKPILGGLSQAKDGDALQRNDSNA